MKQFAGIFVVLVLLAACDQDVVSFIESEKVLTMEQYDKGGVIRTERIEKASSKYKALAQWARANSTSWRPSIIDVVPQLTISGHGFKLTFGPTWVIVTHGTKSQWEKNISPQEFRELQATLIDSDLKPIWTPHSLDKPESTPSVMHQQ